MILGPGNCPLTVTMLFVSEKLIEEKYCLDPYLTKLLMEQMIVLIRGNEVERNREMMIGWRESEGDGCLYSEMKTKSKAGGGCLN